MEPGLIYGDLIRCEDRSAELYLEFSVRFYDHVDVSWFWIGLAMDEKQHAGLLQYCLDTTCFAVELPPKTTINELKRRLTRLETRAAGDILSIDDAFEIAIEIENSEMEDLCQKLTAPISGPPHVVQKKLDLSKKGHLSKLRAAAERFGASTAIRSRFEEIG
jgi:hypothetical protein